MKPIEFSGRSLEAIRNFPAPVRREAGHQLDRVQRGLNPLDWKPIPIIGKGVREIRLRNNGQYRIIYLATLGARIYVLHAFRKKSQKTLKQDIYIAQLALKDAHYRKSS
jgi:phage-related protein